jgi:hypothetical protein
VKTVAISTDMTLDKTTCVDLFTCFVMIYAAELYEFLIVDENRQSFAPNYTFGKKDGQCFLRTCAPGLGVTYTGTTLCECLAKSSDGLLKLYARRGANWYKDIVNAEKDDTLVMDGISQLVRKVCASKRLDSIKALVAVMGETLAREISDLSMEEFIDAWLFNWHRRLEIDEHVFVIDSWPPRINRKLCIERLKDVVSRIENTKAGRLAAANATGSSAPIDLVVSPSEIAECTVIYRQNRAKEKYDTSRLLSNQHLKDCVVCESEGFIATVKTSEDHPLEQFIEAIRV